MLTEEKVDIAWVDKVDFETFRSIVRKYKPSDLRAIRNTFVEKLKNMTSQMLVPMELKVNRDGSPMTKDQYEAWLISARTAYRHTENQLGVVNNRLAMVGFIGAMPTRTVIAELYRMAAGNGPESQDDDSLLKLVRHHLQKETEA